MLPFQHEEGKSLASLCTLGIGGPARFFAKARTISEMQEMLSYCHRTKLPFLILGKGSNCLFDDKGFNGLVILNKIDHLVQEEDSFRVGAGFSFAYLGSLTSRKGYSGLEFAVGIPASVGGAIFMNAGANKQETMQVLSKVTFVTESGEVITLKKEDIEFHYRFSCFQKMKGAIVEGVFALTRNENAKAHQEEILSYRLDTQPYKDKSAGCIFRNPENGSAGRLIDECGLKGSSIGGAAVSLKHANFLINAKSSTSEDFKTLIKEIKESIFRQKGIILEEEVRVIPSGYDE